jgi:hypothetical protein
MKRNTRESHPGHPRGAGVFKTLSSSMPDVFHLKNEVILVGLAPTTNRVRTGCSPSLSYKIIDWGSEWDLHPYSRLHRAEC